MKTIFLIYLISIISVFDCLAQPNNKEQVKVITKHTISAGYGLATANDMAMAAFYVFPFPFSFGISQYDPHFSGAFSAGYQYRFSNRIQTGVNFAYEKIKLENTSSGNTHFGKYYSLLAGLKVDYYKTNQVLFYGRSDLGVLFYKPISKGNSSAIEITPGHFAFQLSPLCMRIGKNIGGYLELGFGSLGILNCGIDYKF